MKQKTIEWLRETVPGKPWKEVYKLYQETFPDEPRKFSYIKTVCYKNGITNGLNGQFKKNRVPLNKGMKGWCAPGSERTWFKKGQSSPNERTIGSEYDSAGYLLVKIKNEGRRTDKWRPKHVLVWEKANGPVPEGHIVVFLDGNHKNFNLDNLACIPRGINAILNRSRWRSDNADITKVRITQAELKRAIKEATRHD
ncbi:HNH endonuclease signature motif containing protein [Ligilactobacillus agilis]|uniref:HNH endonuclease signature motif containing protein n=1 Tax=Ligilactobacillus agilis TaxID=1601 RepID=UPI000B8D5B7B|nr:HNH endonuclease signature motif containing protein [Ligilactobacillus agilis]ASR40290.1 hypothetical protein BEN83_01625 [Ligilactobacillus agilis]